jgi:hypothetical protein
MEEHVIEAHTLAANLQHSREELRRLLLPRGSTPRPPGTFPRSAVMRFLLNPQQRRLGMMLVGAALLLLRRGARGPLNWLQLLQPLLGARR